MSSDRRSGLLPSLDVLNGYLTKAQAAQYLGVNKVTLWHWIHDGKLPAYRIGREVLIEKAELEKMRKYARAPKLG